MTRNIASRLTSSIIKTVMSLLFVLALVIIFNESSVSAEQLDKIGRASCRERV